MEMCNIQITEVKLFGKYQDDKFYIYWNLPTNCLDIDIILLFYKEILNDEQNDFNAIEIDYLKDSTTKKFKNIGKLEGYYNTDRINYNFKFKYKGNYSAFVYIRFFDGREILSNILNENKN